MRVVLPGRTDPASVLRGLRDRDLNYSPGEVRPPEWVFDEHRHVLGREAPGPPEGHGLWRRARELVAAYEFTPPEIIRAFHAAGSELLGRDMLLEARLPGLRFLMGVRVTAVRDDADAERTTWGWSYETLRGHLERGRVDYEVVKHHASGEVEFVARSYSQLHPRAPWWMRLGWRLFGRRVQLRFYRRAGLRLRGLSHAADTVVVVPATADLGAGWALRIHDPVP
ncbi:DUF1990 family protein [Saccharothrix coeruleofusca]|uniref:DUF1990 domain-containing protein n=1 Tax=Saccharothrix coeruleofusca TaxID=33919 RepID=A0A918ANB6_9PSEU|nr:DUF1990 family protein [Saccharothrix coeruleofusca]GGP53032.1 hypothetical protein GCM10010185_26440 [Saccharothrix coeruleofusca]